MPVAQDYRNVRGFLLRGIAADRPSVDDVLIGALYFSTDTLVLERSNGVIWESYSPLVGGSGSIGLQGPPGIDGIDGESPDAIILPAYNQFKAGGADSQVQFNDGGGLAGNAGLLFNKTTGSLSFGGELIASSNLDIRRNTADGSDTGLVRITGGGALSNTRGAFLNIYGNENGIPGSILMGVGNVAGSILGILNADASVYVIHIDGNTKKITLAGGLTLKGQNVSLNADTNDWNPGSWDGGAGLSVISVADASADRTITGLDASKATVGTKVSFLNASGFSYLFPSENASSIATNRFRNAASGTVTMRTNGGLEMVYTGARWVSLLP